MHPWLKRAALVCGIFIAVGIGMAMHWNASNRIPTSSDVTIYLVLVPLGLILAIWFSTKILAGATVKPAANKAATESPATAIAASSNLETENELVILASSIMAAAGQSPDELMQALASNKTRPALDDELTDSNGYPVLSGRIHGVEEEAQREALTTWMTASQMPEASWAAEQIRALAIGSIAVLDLLQQVIDHPLLPAYRAAEPAQRPSIALPILQLQSVLPMHWGEEQRDLGTDWFRHLVEQQGWPPERISIRQASAIDHVQPFLMIEQLALQAHQQQLPCFSLLIACDSYLGDTRVLEWESAGKLLNSSSEAGLVPGEGAAGFLFADKQAASRMKTEGLAKIHRPHRCRREKSADSSSRIRTEMLTELTQKALESAAIPAEKIALVAADTDHRASRVGELIGTAHAVFPELDLKTQCCKVAAACGFAGTVSSLTALALAHHAAVNHGNPALSISNQDEFECSAVVISPLPDEAASITVLA